jgi:hypothetical protein
MAVEDKKISSLTEWVYSNIVDAANIVVAHAGGNYRIAMSAIRQYVLGNRRIGTNNTGDIVTIDDEQQLTDKILISPGINSPVEITATSTQMNHLSGLGQNVQNALNGIGSNILTIENRIDALGIGGTGSGDIVTTDDEQILTNKTLSSPKINSATSITATSEELNTLDGILSTTNELNKLHYITASTDEINHLTGVTSSIQTQINQIINQLQGITYRIYHYSPGVISGVTSQIINEAELRAEYGISTGYRVNPDSISVSVYKLEGGRWYLLPPAPIGDDGLVFFATTTAGLASQTVLNSIDISLLNTESYRIVINYKVLALAGV